MVTRIFFAASEFSIVDAHSEKAVALCLKLLGPQALAKQFDPPRLNQASDKRHSRLWLLVVARRIVIYVGFAHSSGSAAY